MILLHILIRTMGHEFASKVYCMRIYKQSKPPLSVPLHTFALDFHAAIGLKHCTTYAVSSLVADQMVLLYVWNIIRPSVPPDPHPQNSTPPPTLLNSLQLPRILSIPLFMHAVVQGL